MFSILAVYTVQPVQGNDFFVEPEWIGSGLNGGLLTLVAQQAFPVGSRIRPSFLETYYVCVIKEDKTEKTNVCFQSYKFCLRLDFLIIIIL